MNDIKFSQPPGTMIIKVQRPVIGEGDYLAYARNRQNAVTIQPLDMGDKFKSFFYAKWLGWKDGWQIVKPAPDQDW
jgi:hypothetical protein